MNKYQMNKQHIKELAEAFTQAKKALDWEDRAEVTAYFEKQGKRYGLLKEFKEQGLC